MATGTVPARVPAIRVRGLRKSYGSIEAVAGVDLDVAEGEVFALLGPNGAGKTTIVEILEGYRPRDAGDVDVLGFDPARGGTPYRECLGIVLQECGVQKELTVAETVEMYRGYYPHPKPVDELIGLVGLDEKADARIKVLSGGQRRRLDLALALAGDPDLLFLDEPTTGFDPSARRQSWKIIQNLCALGKTVFLTTHYMDEAQALADRVAVIVEGRIVAEGPPESIGGRHDAASEIRFRLPPRLASTRLPPLRGAQVTSDNGTVVVTTTRPTRALHDLTAWALERRAQLEGLAVSQPSLEDVYLQLTAASVEAEP
jgi:ABC-2 type transport system ATP-binding protein